MSSFADVQADADLLAPTPSRHEIRLDGCGTRFTCAVDETLLRAALRAGVGFPYECNSGGCGSCSFEPLQGEWKDLWPEAPGLGARARQRGRRLACQSIPQGDATIRIRKQDHCIPKVDPQRQTARLIRRRALTRDMVEFSFQAERPACFLPGQFALLDLPDVTGSRAYSMSNLANEDGIWSFVVKQMPGGRGSAALFDAVGLGHSLMLDGPYGMSYLRPEAPRDIVCVAGGSGLSPVLSILAGAVRDPALAGRSMTLLYGGRTSADLCAAELIAACPLLRERVECISAISDPESDPDWAGERGFIHEVTARWLERHAAAGKSAGDFEWYFCGPPRMADAVQRLLLIDLRVPQSQLHYDRFV